MVCKFFVPYLLDIISISRPSYVCLYLDLVYVLVVVYFFVSFAHYRFDDIITFYFEKCYQYETIVELLHHSHDVTLSVRILKRHLKRLGLQRRCDLTPVLKNAARSFISCLVYDYKIVVEQGFILNYI
jgi:hypothetical protein